MRDIIVDKLNKLVKAFKSVLYTDDDIFMANMKDYSLSNDDINKYRYWEWPQGVGLYGLYKMHKYTDDKSILNDLILFYDERLLEGLPSKNINTIAPLLAMAFVAEETNNKRYMSVCIEWAEWIMNDLPRTEEGGFQHITSDTLNEGELWDDTLFMAVLFLAKMGALTNNQSYVDQAKYQFLIHSKYLVDKTSGLWYHGWTFNGRHNFAKALWGRGNCWITLAIPELLSIIDVEDYYRLYLKELIVNQANALKKYQHISGMWHTLIDEPKSYLESSATCGFGAGILMSVKQGLLHESYSCIATSSIKPILELIDDDGYLNQVSYGTPMGRESKQFYIDIPIRCMPYGQALGMLYLIELLKR